jgi:DNA-binding NarL/FixJ family response regulator
VSTRVVIADDQALVRAGLAMLLSAQPDIEVVGEAADGQEAVEMGRRLSPDVMIMDIRMPNLDGVAATRQLTADEFGADPDNTVRVLALTTFHADEVVYEALRAGASGFLLKDGAPSTLVAAVRAVANGDAFLDPTVTRGVVAHIAATPSAAHPTPRLLTRLTSRERETLELMAHGLSNSEIAAHFVVAEATVKTHVCRILYKLEARDRTQAVVTAYKSGVVSPSTQLPGRPSPG